MKEPCLTAGFLADIDKLRGLFALLVLMGHAFDISALYAGKDIAYEILARLRFGLGFVWVVGFVVLSGFCIELSCMKRGGRAGFLLRYLGQRASRIFPLLIVCVAFTGVVEWLMMGSQSRPRVWEGGISLQFFLINLAGLGGFFGQFGSIAQAYTISYELLYYLLWGLSRAVAGQAVQAALLVNFGFALVLVLSPYGIAFIPGYASSIPQSFIVLIYLPWLIGAAAAHHMELLVSNRFVRYASRFGWPILILVIFSGSKFFGMPAFVVSPLTLIYHLLLAATFVLLILRAYGLQTNSSDAGWKRFLGELSYPLYLVHGFVIVFAGFLFNSRALTLPFFIHVATLAIAAVLCAAVLVVAVERPVMRFRASIFKK